MPASISFGTMTERGVVTQLQADVNEPDEVEVEYDRFRKVLYVHMDGYTVLRISRLKAEPTFSGNCHAKE